MPYPILRKHGEAADSALKETSHTNWPAPLGFQSNQTAPLGSPLAPQPWTKEPQCGLSQGQPVWRLVPWA